MKRHASFVPERHVVSASETQTRVPHVAELLSAGLIVEEDGRRTKAHKRAHLKAAQATPRCFNLIELCDLHLVTSHDSELSQGRTEHVLTMAGSGSAAVRLRVREGRPSAGRRGRNQRVGRGGIRARPDR